MWFMFAAAMMQAGGQLMAGRAAAKEAKAQQAMSIRNAQISQADAAETIKKSKFEQGRQSEEGARVMGTLKTRLAASGGRVDVGTAPLILEEQQAELELENMLIGYEGQLMAKRYESQAGLDYMQANIYGKKAKSAKTTSYIGAGTSVLQGFGAVQAAKEK